MLHVAWLGRNATHALRFVPLWQFLVTRPATRANKALFSHYIGLYKILVGEQRPGAQATNAHNLFLDAKWYSSNNTNPVTATYDSLIAQNLGLWDMLKRGLLCFHSVLYFPQVTLFFLISQSPFAPRISFPCLILSYAFPSPSRSVAITPKRWEIDM